MSGFSIAILTHFNLSRRAIFHTLPKYFFNMMRVKYQKFKITKVKLCLKYQKFQNYIGKIYVFYYTGAIHVSVSLLDLVNLLDLMFFFFWKKDQMIKIKKINGSSTNHLQC